MNDLKQFFTFGTRRIVRMAIIAALYYVFTMVLAPISFGALQFRAANLLKPLALLSPDFGWGLSLGVFFANTASPFGALDFVVMPIIDLCMVFVVWKLRGQPVIALGLQAIVTGAAVAYFPLYLGGGVPLAFTLLPIITAQAIAGYAGHYLIWNNPNVKKVLGD